MKKAILLFSALFFAATCFAEYRDSNRPGEAGRNAGSCLGGFINSYRQDQAEEEALKHRNIIYAEIEKGIEAKEDPLDLRIRIVKLANEFGDIAIQPGGHADTIMTEYSKRYYANRSTQ